MTKPLQPHPFARLKASLSKARQVPEGSKGQPPLFLRFSEEGITRYDPAEGTPPFVKGSGDYTVALYPHSTPAQVEQLADAWRLDPRLRAALLKPMHGKFGQFEDVLYLPLRGAQYIDKTGDVRLIPLQVLLRGDEMAILSPEGVWVDGRPLLKIGRASCRERV